jgi:hypothetical protein
VAPRPIYHYQYWSSRLTKELADDVRVNLQPTWLWKLSATFHGAGVEAQRQGRALRLDEMAAKLETSSAVHRFTGSEEIRSTPFFVRGAGRMTLMRSWVGEKEGHSSVIYGTVQTLAELTAHICLFGSIANFIGYRDAGREQAGWTSSAWADIQELIDTRGAVNNSQWDNEARAFEAAKWGRISEGDSQLRFDELEQAEWCALIYSDVTPTPGRWIGGDWEQQTGRILIGSPLWVRTALPTVSDLGSRDRTPSYGCSHQ